MAKSSSIYIGEAKMALAGKWQSALVACSVAIMVAMIPTFAEHFISQLTGHVNPGEYQTYEEYRKALTSSNISDSTYETLVMVINVVWTLLFAVPVMLACLVGIRQMHIEGKSPVDEMVSYIRTDRKELYRQIWNAMMKTLRLCVIPLALYVVFTMLQKFVDDYYAAERYESLASLSKMVFMIMLIYKSMEYIFISYIKKDNPDLEDEDVLSNSETLVKGNKLVVCKIAVRAALPIIPIVIGLFILFFFLAIGAMFGSIFVALFNDKMDLYSIFGYVGPVWYYVYVAIKVLILAYVLSRFLMACSVLYSELTNYAPKSSEDPDKEEPKDEQEKSEEENKGNGNAPEDIKLEPEIPYEQRYMPR